MCSILDNETPSPEGCKEEFNINSMLLKYIGIEANSLTIKK